MADSEESFRRAFGLLAFAMNRHLAQHMRRVSRALDADLESVFVWATLAHMNAMNIALPGMDPLEAPTVGDAMLLALHPVRLTDVVQVTGLPRETVRRKLERLREQGRVERLPDGSWRFRTDAIGSDAFRRDAAPGVEQLLADPVYVDYAQYARYKGKIVMQK